jgi:hypothetical protein
VGCVHGKREAEPTTDHGVGGLSALDSVLGSNQRGTGATQRTPGGTHTDEGKGGSAYARTERLEDRDNWRS